MEVRGLIHEDLGLFLAECKRLEGGLEEVGLFFGLVAYKWNEGVTFALRGQSLFCRKVVVGHQPIVRSLGQVLAFFVLVLGALDLLPVLQAAVGVYQLLVLLLSVQLVVDVGVDRKWVPRCHPRARVPVELYQSVTGLPPRLMFESFTKMNLCRGFWRGVGSRSPIS